MSEVYRRLAEALPAGVRSDLPFSADARHAAAWLEGLPRTDVSATRRALLQALAALSSAPTMKGASRREIAEVLRPIVLDVAMSTRQAYAGKPLPLAGELSALPSELAQLHLRLAHAYRLAAADACAPSGSLPWFRGGAVGDALQRAAFHYVEAMRVAWCAYATLPAHAWRGLHRTYQFAVARELERRPSSDTLVAELPNLQRQYLQALLMSVLDPRSFSQAEQEGLWSLAEAFAGQSPLRDQATSTAVGVADDADEGPGGKVSARHWLDLVALATAVETALRGGGEKAVVVPERGPGVEFSTDALGKVRRAFSQAASRQFLRLEGGHLVDTVFGLSGLHYIASGARDFDAFARQVLGAEAVEPTRAAWAAGGGDHAARATTIPATAVDQSLGGYRVRWMPGASLRLRVGEVVGLRPAGGDEEGDWMIGLLRWLHYEPEGTVLAGVELLSRSVAPVAMAGRTPKLKAPLRVLELRPPGGDDWLYLSPQRLPQGETLELGREGEPVERMLDRRPEGALSDLRLLQRCGDYFLYRHPQAQAPVQMQA